MTERDNQEPPPPPQQQQQQSSSGTEADNTTVRTQAAFVNKLYKMLEDISIQSLISWSEKGDLFSVSNPTAFSKSVLPQYFKHNNWQSFVRQLNMYGFHKVNDMIHSNLTSDNQTWEFRHPHFKRGEIEDLQNIKRKSTKPSFSSLPSRISSSCSNSPSTTRLPFENDEDIYGPMYKHILHIEDRLHHVSRSYEILKNETNILKSLLSKQQETISEFAALLGDVLDEDVNPGVNAAKRETILAKLNDLQSLFVADNTSQGSSSSNSYPMLPPTEENNHVKRLSYNNNISPTTATRSFEQFLQSQQHHQYQNPSYSPDPNNSSHNSPQQQYHHHHRQQQPFPRPPSSSVNQHHPHSITPPTATILPPPPPSLHHRRSSNSSSSGSVNNVSNNRRMGFGKESHLLNPEPSNNAIEIEDNKFIKKRRTE